MSIRASKQIVQKGLATTVENAYREQFRYPAVKALFRSADIREGPLAFASSDYARDQAGWFEGAVIAGEDAADAVMS